MRSASSRRRRAPGAPACPTAPATCSTGRPLLPQSPALRTRAAALDGAVAARTGAVERARDVYLAAGTEAADDDPDTAVMLLAESILASQFAGDVGTAEAAARLIAGLEPRTARGPVGRCDGDLRGGHPGRRGRTRPPAVGVQAEVDTFLDDPQLAPWLVVVPLYLRESAVGRDVIPTVVAHSRRRSDIGGLPILLFYVARDQATTDRWDDAVAGYTEAIQLAREAGQATDVTACLAGLSWLEARRGDADACRAHAEEALALAGEHHLGFFQTWAMTALAELELGLGRTDAALERYRALDAVLTDLGLVDVDLSPAAEMVEAMVHLGLADEASALARSLTERAELKGQPWSMARAARAAGLTCPDPDVDVCFSVALAYHQHTPDDFEAARTELAYGSRLRRLKRRVDARPHLRTALAAFERLGAVPWADQAAAELRATGETAQRRSTTGLDHLTPQELQVARMLAQRADHAGDRRRPVPQPEDDRVPPAQRVPEARDPVPGGAGGRDPGLTGKLVVEGLSRNVEPVRGVGVRPDPPGRRHRGVTMSTTPHTSSHRIHRLPRRPGCPRHPVAARVRRDRRSVLRRRLAGPGADARGLRPDPARVVHAGQRLARAGSRWPTSSLTGLMVVAFAVGLRRALVTGPGFRWVPRLVAVFGAGLVLAGVFRADPADGFPVGVVGADRPQHRTACCTC